MTLLLDYSNVSIASTGSSSISLYWSNRLLLNYLLVSFDIIRDLPPMKNFCLKPEYSKRFRSLFDAKISLSHCYGFLFVSYGIRTSTEQIVLTIRAKPDEIDSRPYSHQRFHAAFAA